MKPTPKRTAVVALAVSLMFGVGLAFLFEYLDDTIKSKENLGRATRDIPTLGLIPVVGSWKDRGAPMVVSLTGPKSPVAEADRSLRTAIQFTGLDRRMRTIQVTNPGASEGKSTTIAYLAVALAQNQHLLLEGTSLYCAVEDLCEEDLVREYTQSDVLTFVSTYEGFGLPIIEAQAVGLPVITANVSSMPEVAGEGALLIDPLDTGAIRDSVARLIESPDLAQSLVGRGRQNVTRFLPGAIAEMYGVSTAAWANMAPIAAAVGRVEMDEPPRCEEPRRQTLFLAQPERFTV